jgi:catechol 2,3-dioxygenase-like lactoylglutathione lyase family enzyme
MLGKSYFMKLDHIGVVVKDMNKALEFYRSLGVGPFDKSGTPGKNQTLHGKSLVGGKTNMIMGKIGNLGIQITQPLEPPSISFEFLKEIGEGINHIAYKVDDIKRVTAEVKKKGYEIIFTSEYVAGGGEIYINTGNNFSIQLFEPSPE